MPSILHLLSRTVLEELARALASNRIHPPYRGFDLRDWLSSQAQPQVAAELERLRAAGMTSTQIAIVMDLLAVERARQQRDADRIEMVWTGPDQEGPSTRDTGVVAREMLGEARKDLLVTTLSISRDSTTFKPLNDAMERNPKLDVTLVLNIELSKDSPLGQKAVNDFAKDFWLKKWPWRIRPKVFYDPRGVNQQKDRALQHAKCIVADVQKVFVTSSNYTESGQLRNIELGIVIKDARLAARVVEQFRSLINKEMLLSLPD